MTLSRLRDRIKVENESLVSLLTLTILGIQVVLLVLLTEKVTRLEQTFARLAGGGPPQAPVIVERIPDERRQVKGPDNAQVTIVAFSDFECSYCADATTSIKEILEKYPQVRFVYRHFPLLGIHSNAFRAAEATECAAEQGKFWDMHDKMFTNQSALGVDELQVYAAQIGLDVARFNDCLASGKMKNAVEQDLADGQKYGVNGTPTFFVNNAMIIGASNLEAMVEDALPKP